MANSLCQTTPAFVLKSRILNMLTWDVVALQSLELPPQPRPFTLTPVKSLLDKGEITFERRIANITGPVAGS